MNILKIQKQKVIFYCSVAIGHETATLKHAVFRTHILTVGNSGRIRVQNPLVYKAKESGDNWVSQECKVVCRLNLNGKVGNMDMNI